MYFSFRKCEERRSRPDSKAGWRVFVVKPRAPSGSLAVGITFRNNL